MAVCDTNTFQIIFSQYLCILAAEWVKKPQIEIPLMVNECLKCMIKCILKITILLLPLLTKLEGRGM